jgi:hypothetical protein
LEPGVRKAQSKKSSKLKAQGSKGKDEIKATNLTIKTILTNQTIKTALTNIFGYIMAIVRIAGFIQS